jgi:DNA helicase HerA-like ATPase
VIELWPFTDNEEKAFIMALLLIKLYEYRQRQDITACNKIDNGLEHVLVIEEAHRLLSKPQSGGEHSSNGRQKAVESFADILAEIRSYGQGIIVVDQIPSKLISDVLKNTDVKIAHRLADKEDRDILGATMNLTPEQMKDLARLSPGEAIVYFGGLRQAVKLKVELTPVKSN